METGEHASTDPQVNGTSPKSAYWELSQTVLGSEPLTTVLDQVTQLMHAAVPDFDEVSITVVEGERPISVVFTGSLAVQLDERQYEQGFGPCLHAARTGGVVPIPDTSTDFEYVDFSRQACRMGVTRSLSFGLAVPGRNVGSLNLYALSGHGFDEATVAAAQAVAAYVAAPVANAALYARTTAQVEQMREAMASRSVIEQAKGMIMSARDCTADEAFTELRRLASRANRKVRVVAEEIVEGRGRDLQ